MKLIKKVMQNELRFLSVVKSFLPGLLGIQNNLVLVPVRIKRTRFNQ